MSTTPLPTRLVFLSDLSTISTGEKVRFLGCVTKYSTVTGTITLQHAYPSPLSTQHSCPTAMVDVNLLLSTLKSTDTQVGEWVNVIGYVQGFVDDGDTKEKMKWGSGAGPRNKEKLGQQARIVGVQAVMFWSAGGVKLSEYEKVVEMRKKTETESEGSSI
ncbi:MAG: hypothetical protein LQ346_004446 [Caloplaca aetnensis]|nr:MAG: hypothetical protein LQ346_004446 [Caloplaca aetnensis]